jgi:hypothetical protein
MTRCAVSVLAGHDAAAGVVRRRLQARKRVALLRSQRDRRIDSGSASSWNPARDGGHSQQESDHAKVRERIEARYPEQQVGKRTACD